MAWLRDRTRQIYREMPAAEETAILAGNMAVAYFMVHAPRGFFPLLNGGELAIVLKRRLKTPNSEHGDPHCQKGHPPCLGAH